MEPATTAGLPPVLDAPLANVRLTSSLSLGMAEVNALASGRFCSLVGVVGFPNAGKTAALVSLYLLIAKNMLGGFEFRDSRTLMALEQVSRGARRWDATALPEQLTAHTESTDGRTAGYLHLRLHSQTQQRSLDLLIPDLPGEWTSALADENRADRLEFLRSASVIWLFVDGRQLLDLDKRNHAIHRTEIVLKRLVSFIGKGMPPVTVVITHRDKGVPDDDVRSRLSQATDRLGIRASIVHIASFTSNEQVTKAGSGLVDLLEPLTTCASQGRASWSDSPRSADGRSMLAYRDALR